MYCQNCGKELREGSAFCTNCGFSVNENVGIVQEESSDIVEKSVNQELTLTSSDTKSAIESQEKEKWGMAYIVGFIIFGIVDLWLTGKLIKFWVYPYLGIPDTSLGEVIEYLLLSNHDESLAVIKFLPYCGLCLVWVSSVLYLVMNFACVFYYAIKGEPENVKSASIALIIAIASSLISGICLVKEKVFWTVLIILVIVSGILNKMGILDDKNKKENKEK